MIDLYIYFADVPSGFGRVTLPNILPLEGVQDSLQLFVQELELAALTETSLLLTFATNQVKVYARIIAHILMQIDTVMS